MERKAYKEGERSNQARCRKERTWKGRIIITAIGGGEGGEEEEHGVGD